MWKLFVSDKQPWSCYRFWLKWKLTTFHSSKYDSFMGNWCQLVHCCISNSKAYNNIFFGVKHDIMLKLLELAKMIKCFGCSRCSAKSFIKKSCHAHAQSVMDCGEIKSDTLYIYSIRIFSTNWSNGNDLQMESGWSWTKMAAFHNSAEDRFLTLSFGKNAELNYESTAKGNWHDLIKNLTLQLHLDFHFHCDSWIFSLSF